MSEKEQFNKLCEYVKSNILRYNDTMKVPKHLVLRLKGLHHGQFIANSKQEINAVYGYDLILETFRYSAYDIKTYIDKKKSEIKDERHLINIIMTFVENNINTVSEKLKQKELSKQKIENLDNSQLNAQQSNYIPKTDNSKFRKDLM